MRFRAALFLVLFSGGLAAAQQAEPTPPRPSTLRAPSLTDILRGEYGRYRANNDLLYYDLDIRVNPEKKFISGKNTIRFKMLKDDTRIQLELFSNYTIEKIVMGAQTLKYERDHNTVYVDFPETLRSGRTYSIEFHYSGQPREQGRFGAMAFRTDPAGKHWINTANEGEGSASWWPSKDQWRDEPEGADIRVAVPNGLTNVSNGRFMGKTDLGDGYTRWDYRVHYPINSYNVSLNIAEYTHFSELHGDLTMDYFVLPGNLEKAKVQFAQAKPMIEAFEKYVGKYPFPKDGFKLIEVPYSGMEHQSAVTYGNRYANGYLERDWTGVGVSLKFDFIIIHESGHEWFGNAISAADVSDMWIQEGWCNYLEFIYVEALFGREDAIKYANGYKSKIGNARADHHAARHPSHAEPGHVFQRRAVPGYAAERRRRRHAVVEVNPRYLRALQVPEHHDRGPGPLLQRRAEAGHDADLRSVSAADGVAGARADVRRGGEDGGVSMEGGRAPLRDANQGRRSGEVADDSADDRLEVDGVGRRQGRVQGRDRVVLRERPVARSERPESVPVSSSR